MDFDYNVEKQEITVELNTPKIELDTPSGGRGLKGDKGNPGAKGDPGDQGIPGKDGEAATITVGSTTTGDAGTDASVTNSGTTSAAVLDFTIPKGDKGDTGPAGQDGQDGQDGTDGISPIITTSKSGKTTTITIVDAEGTKTATILDGNDGASTWGDITGTLSDQTDLKNALDGKIPYTTITSSSFRVWNENAGWYYFPNQTNVYYKGTGSDTFTIHEGSYVLVLPEKASTKRFYIFDNNGIYRGSSTNSSGTIPKKYINGDDINNDLVTTVSGYALDARQGKVLNESKQDTLVSGTNIKTINNTSLLGSGNLSLASAWGDITGTLSNQTDLKNALDNKADTSSLATVATTGDYDDLLDKPTIPTVPTNLSSFIDDLGSSPTHTHSQYLTSFTETDPVFTASAAHGISSTDISNWNAKADMGITEVTGGSIRIWGSETGMYYLPKGTLIYYAGESSMSHYEDDYGDTFLFINKRENGPFYESFWISGVLYRIVTYQNSHGGLDRILNADDIKNTLTETSSYYVYALDARQGKVLKDLIDAIKDGVSIDSFGDVETALGNKQDALVSGTNIKTINSASLLGSGDISVVATETDPVYSASAAAGITSGDISNWNAKADEGIQDLPNTSPIRVWELSEGVYRVPGDKQIFYQPGTSTQLNKTSVLVVNKSSTMTYYACICGSDSRVGVADGVTSYSMCRVINSGDVRNNLTTSSTGYVLDARQGKVLNESKQDTLVSGTNIKTINNNSLLGNGDLSVGDALPIGTEVTYDGATAPNGWIEVDNPFEYSTDEQKIGTWIDGKPIYRKVIDCGTLPNATTKNIAHGISNIDTVTSFQAIAKTSSSNTWLPLPATNPANVIYHVSIYMTNTNIVIMTGDNKSTYTQSYAIIEYTKTTD